MRKQAEVDASAEVSGESDRSVFAAAAPRCSQTWAMLIKRIYEVDPLCCPRRGGQMKVVTASG